MRIQKELEAFVSAYLPERPINIRTDKIIHDSVWGTIRIRRHEVALLDTPLLLAAKMIEELRIKDKQQGQRLIQGDVEDNIRAASILHDVGHGPFSHSSEEIYEDMPQMLELTSLGAEYEGVKPHEVLSSLIIKSKRFQGFIDQLNRQYRTRLDIKRMASAICGKAPKNLQYETDILNGSFDVDKIEYVIRDGRLMGLPSGVDLSRLLASLEIALDPETGQRILTLDINGEITFEQLVFGKMILFNSVYRHHKARVCDCLLKGVFEYIDSKDDVFLGDVSIKSPVDFLWLTDDMLSEHGSSFRSSHPVLHDLMHGLAYRRLPKRALSISRNFIKEADATGLTNFLELRRNHTEHRKKQRELAKEICKRANSPCPEEFVWLDMPIPPRFKEGEETTIREPDGNLLPLKSFFNVDQWAEHFDQHKWRGHVFSPAEHVQEISKAAQKVIYDKYGIKFKPIAWQICHINT